MRSRRTLLDAILLRCTKVLYRALYLILKRHGRPSSRVLPYTTGTHNQLRSDLGIVLQGPIDSEPSREYLLTTIKQLSCLIPPSNIVVSTWENSKIDEKDTKGIAILVKSSDWGLRNNLQRQLKSTSIGLSILSEQGIPYVAKQRVDQRFQNLAIYENAQKLLLRFGEHRMVFSSRNSFYFRLFGFSDMFTVGSIENQKNFWNEDSDYSEWNPAISSYLNTDYPWPGTKKPPWSESWLNIRFAFNQGFEFSPEPWEDNLRFLRDSCVLLNSDFMGHVWRKDGSHLTTSAQRLMFHEKRLAKHREWCMEDWLSLYTGAWSEESPETDQLF